MPRIVALRFGQVNCYLLRKGGHSLLVDCAPPGYERRLVRALHSEGLAPEAIELLVLTHAHADHSGTAEYLRQHHGVPIALHFEDVTKPRPLRTRGIAGQMLLTASKAVIGAQQRIEHDYTLEDGLRLDIYGIPAEIVHLPPHRWLGRPAVEDGGCSAAMPDEL